jgi:hypothetical protein
MLLINYQLFVTFDQAKPRLIFEIRSGVFFLADFIAVKLTLIEK